jgi:transposase InsO family protein
VIQEKVRRIIVLHQKGGFMGEQRHTAEQIISKLREAKVLQSKGMAMEGMLRQLRISDVTYYKTSRPHSSLGYGPPAPATYIFHQVANA